RSSTNATNFGSIINGINSTTATVGFNEISTSPTGILQVDVVKCGQTFTDTYIINLIENPVLTIGTIANICPLDTGQVPVPITVTPIDRKSTRLNSSHVKISYAVFCLKK